MTPSPRKDYEEREKLLLAPYAQLSATSLGRMHKEKECIFRTCFYRDLGRIVHSTAFRLLEYKTQVFVNSEGDYYRTRLTHSLEVSQMARGVARILRLNEDLANTIALAHDLGHAPFGHVGEMTLNELMKNDGGFEHNVQGYRVVTVLEERYPDFAGLNLSYEVLEGIVKHVTAYDTPHTVEGFRDAGHPTLEAQLVNAADEIAFMNHDLDDGIHWGMLSAESLKDVPLWAETFANSKRQYPTANERILRIRTISDLIDRLITDLQAETVKRIKDNNIETLADVREGGNDIVSLSPEMKKKTLEAKDFLYQKVYRHPKVVEQTEKGAGILQRLFNAYLGDPKRLPEKFHRRFEGSHSKRHICDYIAGMTDRYALKEYQKLV